MLKINIKKYSIMKKIIIIGAGAMGSAFAVPCLENQNDVTLVGTHLEDDLITVSYTHLTLPTSDLV